MSKQTAPRSAAPGWPDFAVAWCTAFAVLHVYWAVGGEVGLAESAGVELARRRPTAFVLIGLWGVAALLVVGVVFWSAVSRGWLRSHRMRRSAAVVGLLGGALLLVRGAVLEVVLLLDTGGIASAVGPGQTQWSLWLWNPWFVVGGMVFLVAARRLARP